jgi:hypothetical protein
VWLADLTVFECRFVDVGHCSHARFGIEIRRVENRVHVQIGALYVVNLDLFQGRVG